MLHVPTQSTDDTYLDPMVVLGAWWESLVYSWFPRYILTECPFPCAVASSIATNHIIFLNICVVSFIPSSPCSSVGVGAPAQYPTLPLLLFVTIHLLSCRHNGEQHNPEAAPDLCPRGCCAQHFGAQKIMARIQYMAHPSSGGSVPVFKFRAKLQTIAKYNQRTLVFSDKIIKFWRSHKPSFLPKDL